MRVLFMSDNIFIEDRCYFLFFSDFNGECLVEIMMFIFIVYYIGKLEVSKVEIKVSDSIKLIDVVYVVIILMRILNIVNFK